VPAYVGGVEFEICMGEHHQAGRAAPDDLLLVLLHLQEALQTELCQLIGEMELKCYKRSRVTKLWNSHCYVRIQKQRNADSGPVQNLYMSNADPI